MFHQNTGANISLDDCRKTAAWSPMVTGGCAFLKLPLAPNQPITFNLDGSGAVELGVIRINPALLVEDPPNTAAHIPAYIFLNEVKIHKRNCRMTVSINSSGTEVTSSYGSGQYVQKVPSGKPYWLVHDVKYGQVEVKIENQGNENNSNEFLPVHGNNIQLMNDTTLIRSRQKTPATVTFIESPLKPGQRLVFHCKPRSFQGTIPGRYSVTARLSRTDPVKFKKDYPAEFDISVKDNKDPDLIEVEGFEKNECNGDILLDVTEDTLAYTTATGKMNKHPCPIKRSQPTWLLLWLYGVSVTAECLDIPEAITVERTRANVAESDINTYRNSEYLEVSNARADRTHEETSAKHVTETRKLRKSVDGMKDAVQQLAQRLSSREEDSPVFPGSPTGRLPPIPIAIPIPTTRTHKCTPSAKQTGTEYTAHLPAEESMVMLGETIKQNFVYLRDTLNCYDLLDYLYQADLITLGDMNEISSNSKIDANRKVLTLLSQRPINKKVLVNALEKTLQAFLVPTLFPESQKE